jgi:hypothetical protein
VGLSSSGKSGERSEKIAKSLKKKVCAIPDSESYLHCIAAVCDYSHLYNVVVCSSFACFSTLTQTGNNNNLNIASDQPIKLDIMNASK